MSQFFIQVGRLRTPQTSTRPTKKKQRKSKQKARQRGAIAAEPLGEPPLFSVRHNLSFNAFLYAVGFRISVVCCQTDVINLQSYFLTLIMQ